MYFDILFLLERISEIWLQHCVFKAIELGMTLQESPRLPDCHRDDFNPDCLTKTQILDFSHGLAQVVASMYHSVYHSMLQALRRECRTTATL